MKWIVLFILSCGASSLLGGESWSRFRGPNGSGIGQAKIPAKWLKTDRRWVTTLPGIGYGSPIVWGSNVFLQAAEAKGQKRLVVCLDTATGKIAWSKAFAARTHRKHKFNSYASSTPTADAERVYACWGTPKELTIVALSHAGELVWRRDLNAVKGGHGFGASPIVHEGMVILNNDQDGDSSLLALDGVTGKTRWEVKRKSLRLTYATPCVFRPSKDGAAQLIFTNWQHGVTSINPTNGKVNWENRLFGKTKERAIGSPLVVGDLVIGTCGFVTEKKHLVAMRPEKVADGKAMVVWRTDEHVPHIPTALFYQEHLYLWADQGILTVVKPSNGEMIYRKRIPDVADRFFGSPVATDGKIFCISDGGSVVVLAAGEKFEVLAVNELDATCRATPAIAGNAMYVRAGNELICIGGR
jgi:outer membrane protein assembly factor BamB